MGAIITYPAPSYNEIQQADPLNFNDQKLISKNEFYGLNFSSNIY